MSWPGNPYPAQGYQTVGSLADRREPTQPAARSNRSRTGSRSSASKHAATSAQWCSRRWKRLGDSYFPQASTDSIAASAQGPPGGSSRRCGVGPLPSRSQRRRGRGCGARSETPRYRRSRPPSPSPPASGHGRRRERPAPARTGCPSSRARSPAAGRRSPSRNPRSARGSPSSRVRDPTRSRAYEQRPELEAPEGRTLYGAEVSPVGRDARARPGAGTGNLFSPVPAHIENPSASPPSACSQQRSASPIGPAFFGRSPDGGVSRSRSLHWKPAFSRWRRSARGVRSAR